MARNLDKKYKRISDIPQKELEDFLQKNAPDYRDTVIKDVYPIIIDEDTYKKYPRVMVGHRAFVYGARDIASDLLMGVMETTELKSSMGIDLSPEDYTIIEVPDTADNAGSDFDENGQNN